MSEARFLFAADLDGTLLPNTRSVPAPGCLERTRSLLAALRDEGIPTCFVSGRPLSLARHGVVMFGLPRPNFWVCNVGTEIYDGDGVRDVGWTGQLGPELDQPALRSALAPIPGLIEQEPSKQGSHKFSFYFPEPAPAELRAEILERAARVQDGLQLIASVEEGSRRALLDLVPATAGKAKAVWHLARRYGLAGERVFFAGDSGNDLDALVSGLCGTLVGNTPDDVVAAARRLSDAGTGARLFVAAAYYGDGVIEGLSVYGLRERGAAADG